MSLTSLEGPMAGIRINTRRCRGGQAATGRHKSFGYDKSVSRGMKDTKLSHWSPKLIVW